MRAHAYATGVSSAPQRAALTHLTEGQPIPFGGNQVTYVGAELADRFRAGDRLVVVQSSGALLHVPGDVHALVDAAVTDAVDGFAALAACTDEQISDFFDRFAAALADDVAFGPIAEANATDVASAAERGRSTTRLVLDATMRAGMIAGLLGWRDSPSRRDVALGRIEHDQWSVESSSSSARCGRLRVRGAPECLRRCLWCGSHRATAVVFRIGSDALGTARAIVRHALEPALRGAGLPVGVVRLVDSPTHAAGSRLVC